MVRQEEKMITISVRNLVEFVLRSGDLDNRRTSQADRDAMQAGSRIHRKIQKQMGAGYQAEVKLSCQIEEEEFTFQVEGRQAEQDVHDFLEKLRAAGAVLEGAP